MSIYPKLTADELIEENASCLSELPQEACFANLNYGLRFILSYLVKHYEDIPDITYASDHLAKIIAQIEREI